MTPTVPANGKYFTKDEVVSRIKTGLTGDEREAALAAVMTLFDGIEHAPIDTLLFLLANRLGMINGETTNCELASVIFLNTSIIAKLGYLIAEEHNEYHKHD